VNLQEQCISLEIATRLKELGCVQESLFYWHNIDCLPSVICAHWHPERSGDFWVAAYTIAELAQLLPSPMIVRNTTSYLEYHHTERELGYWIKGENDYGKYCYPLVLNHEYCYWKELKMADCYGKMLIQLLELNLVKL